MQGAGVPVVGNPPTAALPGGLQGTSTKGLGFGNFIARSTLEEQLQAQEALTRAAEASYRLSDMRYRGGVDSYLGSLIAQRDMYDAQRALIVTRLAGAVNRVQLYQALGGGWKE